MKVFSFICLVLLIVLTVPQARAVSWQTVESGLRYAKIPVVYAGSTIAVHVLAIDPQTATLKPIVVPARASAKSMALAFDALAVLNANFFDTDGKPLGLIVSDNVTRNAFKNISWWSVFCIKDNKAAIFHGANYQAGQCDQAVQSGPRLVIDGQVPQLKDNISKKSAVGLDAGGHVYLIATDNILPVAFFAEFLKMKTADGGLGLTQVLNLDGGSSTQLYANFENLKVDLPNFVIVPVGLGVFRNGR